MYIASLSQAFWYHVCAHAIYLINRMPCQSLQMYSPFSQLYKKPPALGHMKIFGSMVYPYYRPYTTNKLQHRTLLRVFLGYVVSYKGVICYSLATKRLLISRHLVHDESMFPAKLPSSSVISSCINSGSRLLPPLVVTLPQVIQQDTGVSQLSSGSSGSSSLSL